MLCQPLGRDECDTLLALMDLAQYLCDLRQVTYSLQVSGSLSAPGRSFRLKDLSLHYKCGCVPGVGGGGAEGPSAAGDGGRAAVSRTPDADGE